MKKLITRCGKAMAATMVLSTILAGQTQAQTVMDCKMTELPRTGATTERYFFAHDVKNDTVVVMDAITLTVAETPILANITGNTDERLSFKWRVRKVPTVEYRTGAILETTDYSFKAIYFKKQKRLMVRSYAGYHAYDAGYGTCAPRK